MPNPLRCSARGLPSLHRYRVQVWLVFGWIRRPQRQRTENDPVFSLVVTFNGIRMVRAISTSRRKYRRSPGWAGLSNHR